MMRPLTGISLAFLVLGLFLFAISAQPPAAPQPRHAVAEPPKVTVTSEVRTVGSEQVIVYTVTPHRVYDMMDFHVKTLAGNKIGGVSDGQVPTGWTPKANKATKSYSWAGSASNARPLPEGQPTVFALRLTNSSAQMTPAAFWYATRNGLPKMPPLRRGDVTPKPGTAYVGMGQPTPIDAKLRKKRPTITFGPQPPEPSINAPYITLMIPEYTLGEPDEDNVGLAQGSTWTASAASTEPETLFTVLISLNPDFSNFREQVILQTSGNDVPGVAMAHFFEGNLLDTEGNCGFSILVDPQAPFGQEFYALVVADDDRSGTLDLDVDLESDVYAFVVE